MASTRSIDSGKSDEREMKASIGMVIIGFAVKINSE